MKDSTHYIEVYAANGTHVDHDEWASAGEAIDAANTAEGIGSRVKCICGEIRSNHPGLGHIFKWEKTKGV